MKRHVEMLIIASATPAGAGELRLLVARGTCSNNFDGWLIKAAAGTRSFIHCCCCCCCFLLVSKPGEARLIYFANYFTCSRRGLLQDTKWRYRYIFVYKVSTCNNSWLCPYCIVQSLLAVCPLSCNKSYNNFKSPLSQTSIAAGSQSQSCASCLHCSQTVYQ